MSEIVHITFEKLTGLKGTIEGYFVADPALIDVRLPIIYSQAEPSNDLLFYQDGRQIRLTPVPEDHFNEFHRHFAYGTNFLIKELRYGGGVRVSSQNPN